jgi:hypothetical protein
MLTTTLAVIGLCLIVICFAIWFHPPVGYYFSRLLWSRAIALQTARDKYTEVFRCTFADVSAKRKGV